MTKTTHLLLAALPFVLLGCPPNVIEVGHYVPVQDGGSDAGADGSDSGTGGSDAGTGGGDAGTGGAPLCAAGATQSCYNGPAETAGLGNCKGGVQTCAPDGASWGPCVGEVLPQPEDCTTPEDEDCDGMAPACNGVLWAKRFGDSGEQVATALAVDAAGNVIVTGDFRGAVDFGGNTLQSVGGEDIFVAKFDPAGGHLWSQRFGDGADQTGTSVAVDADGNVLVTGTYSGSVNFGGSTFHSAGSTDGFVVKLGPDGTHLWSLSFGDPSAQEGNAVAVDSAGYVLLTGEFSGSVSFGGPTLQATGTASSIFLAKLDPAGGHVWSKSFGDGSGHGVAVDTATNAVVLDGVLAGTANFGGQPLQTVGGLDVFAAKLDAAENHVWSKSFGDASPQDVHGLAVDGAGNVVMAGLYFGAVDFGGGALPSSAGASAFVTKLGPNGAHLWSKSFDGATGSSAAVDAQGNVLVTGHFKGPLDFGSGPLPSSGPSDIFVLKLHADGTHVWSYGFGNGGQQTSTGIAVDASGDSFLTGYFKGTLAFGSAVLQSTGGSVGATDVFVAKLGP